MEKLALEDFTKFKFVSNTKFSPDGKNLAFVVSEMDVDENKYLSNIWLYNIDNKNDQQTYYFQSRKFLCMVRR